MIITSKAPVRIELAGGWTDVEFFANGAGGAVVGASIDQYVTGVMEIYDRSKGDTRDGISVSYDTPLPAGSGLGTSAAMNVTWLGLVASAIEFHQKDEIAELAYEIERVLGILGGKQDQYASAVGGINPFTFGSEVRIEPIKISERMLECLEGSLVLCYTGKQRLSGNIHNQVWEAFTNGNSETIDALYQMRMTAYSMKYALESAWLSEIGPLMSINWAFQKKLHSSITNDEIEDIFEFAFRHGATGGKALGAGGGGCLLFFADDRVLLASELSHRGLKIIPFKFDFNGLEVVKTKGENE